MVTGKKLCLCAMMLMHNQLNNTFDCIVLFLVEDNVASSIDIKDINRLKMSDDYVLCFIHWRRGDVEAAVKMAILVLKWRKENNINGNSTFCVVF